MGVRGVIGFRGSYGSYNILKGIMGVIGFRASYGR